MISPLAQVHIPAATTNYTKGRPGGITEITVHHMAGVNTAEGCGNIFANPERHGSSHYGIGNDGKIGNYVDEVDTAWTNSNWKSNCRAVTIETSNSSLGGDWPVSDAAYESLVHLVADIASRNGITKLEKGKNLTWHQMYTKTTCPGPYLLNKMDDLVSRANQILEQGEFQPENPMDKLSDKELAEKVIRGDYGNGEDRKKALGDRYDSVQRLVNEMLAPNQDKQPDPAPTGNIDGKTVVPVKCVDVNGTPLIQYDDNYIVTEDAGDTVVLSALRETGPVVWARLAKENVRVIND